MKLAFRSLPLLLVLLIAVPLLADESKPEAGWTDAAIQQYAAAHPGSVRDTGQGFIIVPGANFTNSSKIEPHGESFGRGWVSQMYGGSNFSPQDDAILTMSTIPWVHCSSGSIPRAYMVTDPPHNAMFNGVYVNIRDNSNTLGITIDVFKVDKVTDAQTLLGSYASGTTAVPGTVRRAWIDIPDQRIDTWKYLYFVRVIFGGTGSTLEFHSVEFWFHRAMATPTTQHFSDVPPSNPFYQAIEALLISDVTTGYADGTFKPNNNITRGEMAALLGRALGLGAPSDVSPVP